MRKKTIVAAIAVLILSLCAVMLFSYFSIRKSVDSPLSAGDSNTIDFEIKQGQRVDEIGANLEKEKLIAGKDFFKIYLWESGLGSKLKPGVYKLSPSMTIAQMVVIFTGGEIGLKSNEARVVITEGDSDEEILKKLKEAGVISEDEDFDDIKMDPSRYDFLKDKPEEARLQGYLFPDTYNFFKNSSLRDITGKLLDNFDKKLTADIRVEIKKQDKTIYEILIMASIIEKETPNKGDMPTIAGVFYNRLDAGMPLQSDATINYITGAGEAMPTGENLLIDSPFNTYKNKGLPPTPICNPGIEAIKAAIYPEKTDYFYFLMPQDGSGKTIFSKTYDEHLQNKAKYLR